MAQPKNNAAYTVAAVDIGSNSFHMVVARTTGGELQIIDRIKETVRLAAGLDEQRQISAAAQARALACLQRFGQRLRHTPQGRVRAVGTNVLRRARQTHPFISQAEAALGHPIEIIYGAEEARLIYAGVAQDLGTAHPRRLVMDIGGGSTEIILGEYATPQLIESVSLGAVTHSQRYFPDGRINKKRWKQAVLGARVELEALERKYRAAGWDLAIGTSGSIKAVQKVCMEAGWSAQVITRQALERLGKAIIETGHTAKLEFAGLSADRQPIFAGGTAVLTALFESLDIEELTISDKALREGLMLDLLGRIGERDVREASVAAAAARYGVDRAHAQRVAATAQRLLEQNPEIPGDARTNMQLLRWAALLHEIGLAIAHKGYHRHGEYIVRYADMQGFSQNDQAVLAALVRLHRGRVRNKTWADLAPHQIEITQRLALLLRLAVLAHRSRDPQNSPPLNAQFAGQKLRVTFAGDWLLNHPLTREDLARESKQIERAGYQLEVV